LLNDHSISYCDFSKTIDDEGIQRFVGGLHVYEAPEDDVLFLTTSYQPRMLDAGDITFDTLQVDHSNSFHKETGVFKVPASGDYAFFFNCFITKAGFAEIEIYVNGKDNLHFWNDISDDSDGDRQFPIFWSMQLNTNDEVKLYNYYGNKISIGEAYRMYFMGYKLN